MSRRIIYLINPVAGTRGKQPLETFIIKRTTAAGIDFEIAHSRADGNYDALIKKIKAEKFTDIVVCGGDGTINSVVSATRFLAVNIGIIPMGSGNGLAFAARIPKQPGKALDIIFANHHKPADAFSINEHFSCMLCGIGFDAAVAHDFAKQKKRGLRSYIKVSTQHFFKAKPYRFELQVKNRLIKTNAFFISVANANQFGNHFTIAPKARLNDGLLDIVVVQKMNKLMLLFSVFAQLTGLNALQQDVEKPGRQNIIYLQTETLTILNPENAPLHIDGDPGETAGNFSIGIIKNCFRLLQPSA